MKRLLLLLCALVTIGVSGAWATIYQVSLGSQVTDLATLSDANYYVLQNDGGSKLYNYYDGTGSTMAAKSNYDYSSVVHLFYSTGKVQIQQVCTDTYYQTLSNGAVVTLGATPVDYTITSAGDNKFFLANNNLKLNANNTGNFPKGADNSWEGAFSQWKIYEVTLTVTEDDPTDLSFYLRNTAGGYVSTSHSYTTSTYDAIKFKVAQGTGENSAYYTIYDCTTGKYVNFTGTANGTENVLTNADAISESSYWTITKTAKTSYPGYNFITPKGGSSVSWIFFGGNQAGSVIGLWTSTQNGYWKFEAEVPDFGDYAYTLVNERNSLTAATAGATSITTIGKADLAYLASDGKQQFAFVYSSLGNCYLYNVGTTKFVNKNGSLSEYPSDAITFEKSGNWEYPWVIKFDDSHFINVNGENTLLINDWGSGDGSGDHDKEYDAGNMFKTPDRVAYDLTTAESKLVANVTYQIVYGGSNSISAVDVTEVGAALSLPNVLKRGYIESYTFYSDAACTAGNEITTVPTGGNVTVYVKAVLSASCPITFSTEASPVWYVLQGRARTDDATKHQSLYSDGTNVKASADPDATDAYKWAFIGNPFAFQLMNATQDGEGNNYYVVPGATNSANATVSTTGTTFGLFKNARSSESGHIAIATYDGTNESVLNLANGTASTVDTYVGTGATFTDGSIGGLSNAYFMTKAFSYASFAEIYFANNSIGTKMALSTSNTVGYPKSTSTGYTELNEATLAAEWNSTTYATLQTKYAAFLEETEITMPVDGKVYKLTNVQKNNSTKIYLYNNTSNHELALSTSAISDGSELFVCHAIDAEKGQFAFVSVLGRYMVGATGNNGKEMSETYTTAKQKCTLAKHTTVSSAVTSEVAFGKVSITFDQRVNNTSTAVLLVNSTGTWNGYDREGITDTYSSMFILEECNDYYNKVTLTSDGSDAYASLYLPFAVTIPNGITAYAVTSENGVTAHMEEIVSDGTLPKETAAILVKEGQESNQTVYLSPAEEAGSNSTEAYSGFGGTVTTTTRASLGEGNTYVLANGANGLGLYNYEGINLAKGKAYLHVAAGDPAVKSLIFDFGNTVTAIEEVEELSASGAIVYDLSGRRVSKPARGLYIVNGKKVTVK